MAAQQAPRAPRADRPARADDGAGASNPGASDPGKPDPGKPDPGKPDPGKPDPSKKEQVVSLYRSGVQSVEDLALLTDSRPSYIAGILQQEELASGYFDLYTSTSAAMNVYSKFFAGKLGFRDVETAEESVGVIDRMHRQFERTGDRAGQHHALMMALVMFNRARWTGKEAEADVFRRWLQAQLAAAPGDGTSQLF